MTEQENHNDPVSNPLVSIILATYNRADLIPESIQSVIDQTYTNWELIIVDDGSDDCTSEVLQSFPDPRINCIYIEHTGLLGKVRNIGIRDAKGEWIAFQDSDDIWLPDKLQIQMDLLKKYPEMAFILSSSSQFGENATWVPDYESLLVGNLFLPILKEKRFHFCGTSLLFKTSVTRKIGLLDEGTRMMREFHFFLRMSATYKGIFTNQRLVRVRRHSNNTSNAYLVEAHSTSIKMLTEFFNNDLISKKLFKVLASECYYKIGIQQLKQQQASSAAQNFLKSTKLNPANWKNFARLFQALLWVSTKLFHKTTTTT